jgi:hypothetical protein
VDRAIDRETTSKGVVGRAACRVARGGAAAGALAVTGVTGLVSAVAAIPPPRLPGALPVAPGGSAPRTTDASRPRSAVDPSKGKIPQANVHDGPGPRVTMCHQAHLDRRPDVADVRAFR